MGDPNDPKEGEPEIVLTEHDLLLLTAFRATQQYSALHPNEAGSHALPKFPKTFEDRYRHRGKLGAGGMGTVYIVEDTLLGRRLALKVLPQTSEQALVTRFLLEARVTAQVQHPNIVYLHDFVVLPTGELALLLPLIEGESLKDALSRSWGIEEFAHFFLDICSAVSYLHTELGVMHRDIKPGNIIVGKGGRGRLIDLGLVKVLALPDVAAPIGSLQSTDPASVTLTRSDQILGTIPYMSPGQATGSPAGPEDDVYALGVVLYEGLTGQQPIDFTNVQSAAQALACIQLVHPVPPRKVNEQIPEELEGIIMKAIAKNPHDRYASAAALEADLHAFLLHEKESTATRVRIAQAIQPVQEYLNVAEDLRICVVALPGIRGKENLNRANDEIARLRKARKRAFEAAKSLAIAAIAGAGWHSRGELARIFGPLFEAASIDAEREQDRERFEECLQYLGLLNDGQYDGLLRRVGTVHLDVDASGVGATVSVEKFEAVSGHEGQEWYEFESPTVVGETPLPEPLQLPWGYYRITVAKYGVLAWVRPVIVSRWDIHLRVVFAPYVRAGFAYVPPGTYAIGGGHDSSSLPYEELELQDGFLVGKTSVTIEEYAGFLNAIPTDQARSRLPRKVRDSDHPWEEHTVQGKIQFFPPEDVDPRQAVTRISWYDAEAYSTWYGSILGLRCTLLPQKWWEITAAPFRLRYPWGDEYVSNFCNDNRNPAGEKPQLLPVGSCPRDVSPFGVCDLSGGAREWCLDPPGDHYLHWKTRRGGACNEAGVGLWLQSRKGGGPDMVTETDGFRVCIPFGEVSALEPVE